MKNARPQTTEASALDKRHSNPASESGSQPFGAVCGMSSKIELCLITATNPPVITKAFYLDENGQLKRSTSADVYAGRMAIKRLDGIVEFAALLESLGTDQCLTYGIAPHDAKLTTEKQWVQSGRPSNPLPRTKEVFSFPRGGGILMLDYDTPKDGSPPLSKDQLFAALDQAIRGFDIFDHVWWPSTSSCIYRGNEQLRGIEGQRIYVHVADACDIQRAGKALNARLWALGYGRFEVSASGSLLERGVFDQSVWQVNRIDFAAGAKCSPGLEQRRGKPDIGGIMVGYGMKTTEEIPDLTPLEHAQATANKEAARAVDAVPDDDYNSVLL